MFLIESPEIILIFTIFFSIFLIFYVKFIRIMIPDDQIHIIKNKKNTMFFGKSINRREYYYNVPSWVPVYGIEEKIFFRWGEFEISFENIKYNNLYKETFESDIKISIKIHEPLKTIRFSKSYEWVIALLKRDILLDINKEMSRFDGNEIMEKSEEANFTIKNTISKTAGRYWAKIWNVKIYNTQKTSNKADIPDFDLEKISKLWENASKINELEIKL